jgi:hypothetical protein
MRKNIGVVLLSVCALVLVQSASRAQDAKFAAESLKYSRDFYSKVHLESPVSSPVSDLNAGL